MTGQLGRGLVCGVAPHRWRRCASPPSLDEFTHPAHNTPTCAVEYYGILARCASMSTCDAYMYFSRPDDVSFSTRRQGRGTPTLCMYNDTQAWSALHVLSPQCAPIRRVFYPYLYLRTCADSFLSYSLYPANCSNSSLPTSTPLRSNTSLKSPRHSINMPRIYCGVMSAWSTSGSCT